MLPLRVIQNFVEHLSTAKKRLHGRVEVALVLSGRLTELQSDLTLLFKSVHGDREWDLLECEEHVCVSSLRSCLLRVL